ncbi:MAG: hypothetical protein ABI759_24560 [Candidatus Solibacter sp.]
MDCGKAQEEILESLEKARTVDVQGEIDAHVAACCACAGFAARQKTLDALLSTALTPPELSPAFRTVLRKRIRWETMRLWPDWLPDILHFASCGVATLFCALLLPFGASAVFGAGAAATVMTYVLLTAVRISFEDADGPGQ